MNLSPSRQVDEKCNFHRNKNLKAFVLKPAVRVTSALLTASIYITLDGGMHRKHTVPRTNCKKSLEELTKITYRRIGEQDQQQL